jgi:hypothetical protein
MLVCFVYGFVYVELLEEWRNGRFLGFFCFVLGAR